VLVEPAPASLHELAYRLAGRDSLAHALPLMDADEVAVTRVIAVAGPASIDVIAERLRADTAIVGDTVTRLRERALAYEVDGAVALPELLAQHFAAELQHLRPLAAIVKQALVTDLRQRSRASARLPRAHQGTPVRAAHHVAGRPSGGGPRRRALPPAARRHLDLIRTGELYFSSGREGPVAHLTQAGAPHRRPYHRPELPREVAATLALDASPSITGRPALPPSSDNPTDGSAAAGAAVRALVSLLDEATAHPLARLTKGGVGSRERARLAKRLRIDEPALWIDLAAALA
jgi:hypothetical protein